MTINPLPGVPGMGASLCTPDLSVWAPGSLGGGRGRGRGRVRIRVRVRVMGLVLGARFCRA